MRVLSDRPRWSEAEDEAIRRAYADAARTRVQVRPEDLDLEGRSGGEIVRRAMSLGVWRPLPRPTGPQLAREESDAARERAIAMWLAQPLRFEDAGNDATWSPPAARIA